jgi:hypothetical protein
MVYVWISAIHFGFMGPMEHSHIAVIKAKTGRTTQVS